MISSAFIFPWWLFADFSEQLWSAALVENVQWLMDNWAIMFLAERVYEKPT